MFPSIQSKSLFTVETQPGSNTMMRHRHAKNGEGEGRRKRGAGGYKHMSSRQTPITVFVQPFKNTKTYNKPIYIKQ